MEVVPWFTAIFIRPKVKVIIVMGHIDVIPIIAGAEVRSLCVCAFMVTEGKIFRAFINIYKKKISSTHSVNKSTACGCQRLAVAAFRKF